jgi:MYXO-CTERM domain-containing protein
LLPSTAAIDPPLSLGAYLIDASVFRIANVAGSMPKNWEMGLFPSIAAAETAFAGPSDERSGNPARPDLPPPAPQSPATAGGSSGGSSFVPVVALLALLALVAPTARRRLGEVAAFRAPTPFVCALERPG